MPEFYTPEEAESTSSRILGSKEDKICTIRGRRGSHSGGCLSILRSLRYALISGTVNSILHLKTEISVDRPSQKASHCCCQNNVLCLLRECLLVCSRLDRGPLEERAFESLVSEPGHQSNFGFQAHQNRPTIRQCFRHSEGAQHYQLND